MSRYYGKIGYSETVEDPIGSGIWKDQITERYYSGDTLKYKASWQSSGQVNDDLNVANQISILADPYAYSHFSKIKYAEFMGDLWKVISIEVQRPRLILTIGGLYNG